MKEIFHEFGTAIIAIVTAVLIIGVLFGISISGKTGILKIAGVSVEKEEIDFTSYHDFDSVVSWHNRTKPVAAYTESYGRFFALSNTSFLSRYYAKDMEGSTMWIIMVWEIQNISITVRNFLIYLRRIKIIEHKSKGLK